MLLILYRKSRVLHMLSTPFEFAFKDFSAGLVLFVILPRLLIDCAHSRTIERPTTTKGSNHATVADCAYASRGAAMAAQATEKRQKGWEDD